MVIGMFYGGYGGLGYGSGWIVIVLIGFAVIRMVAVRRRMPPSGGRRNVFPPAPGGPASRVPPSGGSSTATGGPSTFPGEPPTFGGREPATGQATAKIPAGWLTDPSGKYDLRYWSGTEWTEHVMKDGVPGNDPPPRGLSGSR